MSHKTFSRKGHDVGSWTILTLASLLLLSIIVAGGGVP